jgi:hypothetical protein
MLAGKQRNTDPTLWNPDFEKPETITEAVKIQLLIIMKGILLLHSRSIHSLFTRGWVCSSVIEHLLSMGDALSSCPAWHKKEDKNALHYCLIVKLHTFPSVIIFPNKSNAWLLWSLWWLVQLPAVHE